MHWNERIVINPAVLTGKPVIRGTRLAVDFIVGLLAQGRHVWPAIAGIIGTRDDWAGHFSVVEPGRVRMRFLPSKS